MSPWRGRLLAFLLALSGALAASSCHHPAEPCRMCGRDECGNMTFTVKTAAGETIHTCCARCGSHAIAQEGLRPVDLRVRDFETAEELDATQAVFVEGSDVHPCKGLNTRPARDERGCCLMQTYDRCEPSVLAFRNEESARRFIAAHGGTISGWEDLAPSPARPVSPAG